MSPTILGIETPWENFFCAGDWVRHPMPAFLLERACVTAGIEVTNGVLELPGKDAFELQAHPPVEPLAAWIEALVKQGTKMREKGRRKQLHVCPPINARELQSFRTSFVLDSLRTFTSKHMHDRSNLCIACFQTCRRR